MTDVCKQCGDKTPSMFRLNDGIYCQEHWYAAYIHQKTMLEIKALSDRIRACNWRPHQINFDI